MATLSNTTSVKATAPAGNYKLAFALVTSLFFLWGFAISMLDGLNKKVQNFLHVSIAESAWVQVVTFGAYFLMALPAGYFMKRYGYKRGILLGLLLYAGGALLVYPAGEAQSWTFFLLALFVLACGLAFLETAANPYASVLGAPETSEQRLNFAQSFNGVGVITGPMVGAAILFAENTDTSIEAGFDSIQLPYLVVAGLVLLVAAFIYRTPMPEIQEDTLVAEGQAGSGKALFSHLNLRYGILAQFLNVGAQGCIWGFFINYATETANITDQRASALQGIGMIIFMVGRFAGTFLMRYVRANILLGWYSVAIVALLLMVYAHLGQLSLGALMAFFFFQSITFPTIFALGVKDLGGQTKQGSSYIIMGIVGGAAFPPVMGAIADSAGIATSFLLPAACFVYIAWFAFKGSQLR
jgi:MFS transporter, FHS family, L-fucose permease